MSRVNVKKDDRLSHQISIKVPNFYANKGVDLSLKICRSRKAIKCSLQNIKQILEILHHKRDPFYHEDEK